MLALPRFCLRKTTWKAKVFFTSRKLFCGYFQWNTCSYFQKICSWTRYSNAKLIRYVSKFWSDSCVFALERQAKKLNFKGFVTFKRPFGGYFQWNVCIYFQEICSWTRYTNAKLIKYISSFLVALRRFCYRNTVLNLYFHSFFISKRIVGVYLQGNVCT